MHVITLKHTIYVSVSQGDIRTKFTWQKFNKNILETDLLNLSNREKSVVSAGKLFHMLTIQTLKQLRLLKPKYRYLCNIYVHDHVLTIIVIIKLTTLNCTSDFRIGSGPLNTSSSAVTSILVCLYLVEVKAAREWLAIALFMPGLEMEGR